MWVIVGKSGENGENVVKWGGIGVKYIRVGGAEDAALGLYPVDCFVCCGCLFLGVCVCERGDCAWGKRLLRKGVSRKARTAWRAGKVGTVGKGGNEGEIGGNEVKLG
jgi:hypothetical protein